MEPGRKCARGCPGVVTRSVAATGLEDLGNTKRHPGVRVTEHERQDRGGASALGDSSICGLAVRVAIVGADCESQGQPQLAHHATKLHHRICESSRRRLVASCGNSPPSDARHRSRKGICQGSGNFAGEDGRVGPEVCNQMRRVSILGIVGGRPLFDQGEDAPCRRYGCARWPTTRVFGRASRGVHTT